MSRANPYSSESVRSGISHYIGGRAVAAIAGMAVTLLLVRVMPVEDYAVYQTVTSGVTVLVMLTLCGLDKVALNYLPQGWLKASSHELAVFVKKLFLFRMSALIVLLIPVFVVYKSLLELLHIPVVADLLIPAVFFVLLFAFTDFATYCLQAFMLQDRLRLSLSISWVVRLVLVVMFFFSGRQLDAPLAVWIWAVTELLSALFMAAPLIAVLADRSHANDEKSSVEKWPENQAAVKSMAVSNFLAMLVAVPWQPYALRTIAGGLLPTYQAAAFSFFQVIFEKIRTYLPISFFATLTEPLMSAHIANNGDRQKVLDNMVIIVQLSVWLIAPLVTVFAFSGGEAMWLLTGGKFVEYTPALVVLFVQLILGVPVAMLWACLNALGKAKLIWRSVIIPSMFFFPLMLYCGREYGIMGMAVISLLNTIGILLFMHNCFKKLGWIPPIHLNLYVRVAMLSFFVPLPVWVLSSVTLARPYDRVYVMGALLLGAIIYLVSSYFVAPFTRHQALVITQSFPKLQRIIKTC